MDAGPHLALRAPGPADIPALSRLATEAFIAKFGQLYHPDDLAAFLADALSPTAIARELADPTRVYRLAERAGAAGSELAGYCKLGLTCGFPQYARAARVMEIKQLYTAVGATGGGIGAALMEWAMAEFAAHGADEVQLSVWSENFGAQRFYARYGFAKVADVTFRVGRQLDHEFLFARML